MSNQQLTLWHEAERAMPNALARSALFNVDNIRSGGERDYLKQALIASDGCITIRYTGEQLRQDDADVWLQLVHMNRQNLGQSFQFTGAAMLKAIGWSRNDRHRLANTIYRLLGSRLTIEGPREGYAGTLVQEFAWKENGLIGNEIRTWSVTLNQKLVKLYALTHYTRIDWETRLELSPLGKWLHINVLSHRMPWPIPLKRLHEMCGSRCRDPKEWRKMVQAAMQKLVDVGAIVSFEIKDGYMTWKRQGETLQGYSLP